MSDTTNTNPLLAHDALPRFDAIRAEHVEPAMDTLLADAEQALARATAPGFPAQWSALSSCLDLATERLGVAWGAVGHLNAVADTPELRAAYNACLPRVTDFYTRLGANEALYAKYKAVDPAALSPAQRQALRNALRGFVLGGAELQGPARERFAQIQERQAELGQKFSENTLDATDAFAHYAGEDEIAGIPPDVLAAARAAAAQEGHSGYKLTLKMPCYLPVMQFARNRALRERMYRAYVTRASEQAQPSAPERDNGPIIGELLTLRQEEAQLLGYPDFGTLSLVPKMADTPAAVLTFLRDLAAKARPYAEADVADLRAHARSALGLDDPQAWDWPYISEHLKEARYAFSEQEVKQYFTAPRVQAGLFALAQHLFGIRIVPDQAPVWFEGVRFFRIERPRDGALHTVGHFYLDPDARSGKRGGAWMDGVRTRWLRPDTGKVQTPVAHLVCNFAQGQDDKPALLTHDDVITLFHEFGHGLHHLLTEVDELDVAGINGVEWDAVELPSQFMENFCWEWQVLQTLSAHVDTGEPLPRALFEKMLAAKNFQAGMQTLRQVEFALFDMLLHSPTGTPQDFMAVLQAVRDEVAVLPTPAFSRTPHTFSHIFAGGYAAGYYSYKWAEVLSADAYAAFEESALPDGRANPATGTRFRQEILAQGGSRDAMDSFIAFRGRPPQLDALLRHQGMVPPVTGATA
ncbi:MAG: M3 family metallopeptidase [Rhodoferax sp.]